MSSAAPRINQECVVAFNSMNTQESPNDFFVAALEDSMEVTLTECGMGGMARVKEILAENFSARTAVVVFRLTAVDDRENTVSYRTKLVHVIYTGPKTPVMKRAKVGSYNAVFKEKFTSNLYIQTDDLEGDLTEAQIERSLRLSGGAHAPSRYDFSNSSAPGSSSKPNSPSKPTVVESSPAVSPKAAASVVSSKVVAAAVAAVEEVVVESAEAVVKQLHDASMNENVEACMEVFTEASEVVHMDATERATRSYKGVEEIKSFYTWWFERLGGCKPVISVFETTGPVSRVEFNIVDAGFAYGSKVLFVKQNKVLLMTLVTVDVPSQEEEQTGDDLAAAAVAAGGVALASDYMEENGEGEEVAMEGEVHVEEEEEAVAGAGEEEYQEGVAEEEQAAEEEQQEVEEQAAE